MDEPLQIHRGQEGRRVAFLAPWRWLVLVWMACLLAPPGLKGQTAPADDPSPEPSQAASASPADEKSSAAEIADDKDNKDNKDTPHAKLEVSGYGFFGNRRLKNTLRLLEGEKRRPFYDANFVEDAVLILWSTLNDEGYLKPAITADLTLQDGGQKTFVWTNAVQEALPRPLVVTELKFDIEEGVFYYFENLELNGLTLISPKDAETYFIETGTLIPLKKDRMYTPNRLNQGLSSLTKVLADLGYQNAQAHVTELERDDQSGAVDVTIQVEEGRQFVVRSIRQETFHPTNSEPVEVLMIQTNHPYSETWVQDYSQAIKTTNYHLGYPDCTVTVTNVHREVETNVVNLDLLARVRTGPKIKLRDVKFVGQEKTRLSLLENRVKLDERELLDRVKAEEGRYRLAKLGIFESVELSYKDVDEHTRDVIYRVDEGKTINFSLLFGYGSYELLRGGFELEQNNIFGRAHHARLKAIQSFKSSSIDYTYTMPELVGHDIDVFFTAAGLRRKEISFTREELGGQAGVRHFFQAIGSDVSLRYNYQYLQASETDIIRQEGVPNAKVASIITDFQHDRRDNPLYPHKGYKIYTHFEVASEYLGGDVNYQRLEINGSYHHPLDRGRWIHLGLSHGVVLTVSGPETDLPFNKRFFPGGENSVRGYQYGEAAPRNEEGKVIGAESYVGANIEFEQALTHSFSLVFFLDAVGVAQSIKQYPFDEWLYSAGGGINWKTPIGPVRLEYGYNLNRRKYDPVGTLHFSLGFPF